VDGNAVLVGTAEEKGTRFLQIVKTESSWVAEEKWTTRSFRPYFNDYAQHKGFCYGFDGDLLMCIDAHTGAVRWKGSRYGGQVILVADIDTLVVLGQRGDLALVKAAPEKFEEIAKFKALKGKTWNHPIIAHGKLFVRNGEEAACFDLGATAANVKSAAAN
jgi:outer membrane protein assembly factor BamB